MDHSPRNDVSIYRGGKGRFSKCLSLISNRFYSENMSDTEESSGLGLYITEELVHLLGAEMKLATDGEWFQSLFIFNRRNPPPIS